MKYKPEMFRRGDIIQESDNHAYLEIIELNAVRKKYGENLFSSYCYMARVKIIGVSSNAPGFIKEHFKSEPQYVFVVNLGQEQTISDYECIYNSTQGLNEPNIPMLKGLVEDDR